MVWLSTQFDKTSPAFNRCSAVRLIGDLNHDALRQSLAEIIRRHPVLFSRVEPGIDEPEIRFLPPEDFQLPVLDISGLTKEATASRVRELLDEEARRPFDLTSGPLFRAGLYKEEELTHTLFLSTHHIVSDGWSDSVMFRELDALYSAFLEGRESPLSDPDIDFADYVVWQRDRTEGAQGTQNQEYWRSIMDGAPVLQELPMDHARPSLPRMDGGRVFVSVPESLVAKLR